MWRAENPWRCWERTTLPSVLNGPDQLLVRVSLSDSARHAYQSEFRWPALDRLGPNDLGGSYAQITLKFLDLRWSFEMANDGPRTLVAVRCLNPQAATHARAHVETLSLDGRGHIVSREGEVVVSREDHAWRVAALSPSTGRWGLTLHGPLTRPFVFVIEPITDAGRLETRDEHLRHPAGPDAPLTPAEEAALATLAAARRKYLDRFSFIPRELWWMYAAVPYGMGWNVIWAADRGEPVWVCSRDWCVHGNYGAWVMFNWDQFLMAAMAAEFDPELGHVVAGPQVAVQTPEGLIPGIASEIGISGDRGMPPVASFGLLKAYRLSGDRSFVERYYEPLCRYHHWWRTHRDGNGDGLLELGSDPVPPPHPQWQAHNAWAARYEAGMDNHPMYDNLRFNPQTHTHEQADIGLNALHANDALCLSHMAQILGRPREAAEYRAYSERQTRLIEEHLWNDEVGLWLSRDWNGTWNLRASPSCFFPLFLPGIDRGRAERAIRDHLLNPRRFGGRFVIPVCPRDDPAYPEQYYVRGRIWPGHMFLVHCALREAGYEDAARAVARGSVETFKHEWLENGYLRENYNAETSRSDDTPESDFIYSYGMMLPWIAWNHLRDVRLTGEKVTAPASVLADYADRNGALRRRVEPA